MVTLFSIPKPFVGHAGIIQRNALASWSRLPGCEVVLCGSAKGVTEAAREFGMIHLPHVECNSYGTPLLSSAFAAVQRISTRPIMAYANGDIILLNDLLNAAQQALEKKALMVGRRTNLDINEEFDMRQPHFEFSLRCLAKASGQTAPSNAIDYVIFPTHSPLTELPPFAVGRPAWDNWFVGRALCLRMPVIDATDMVLAVHQNHDYSHIPRNGGMGWEGPEAAENRRLAGWLPNGPFLVHTIDDSTHLFTSNGVVRRPGIRHRLRYAALRAQPLLEPSLQVWRRVRGLPATMHLIAQRIGASLRRRLISSAIVIRDAGEWLIRR